MSLLPYDSATTYCWLCKCSYCFYYHHHSRSTYINIDKNKLDSIDRLKEDDFIIAVGKVGSKILGRIDLNDGSSKIQVMLLVKEHFNCCSQMLLKLTFLN